MTLPSDHTPSGASTGSGNAAAQPEVRVMFDRIARRYDLMNLLISAFQEPRWRKRLVTGAGLAARRVRARRRVRHRQGGRGSPRARPLRVVACWAWTCRPA